MDRTASATGSMEKWEGEDGDAEDPSVKDSWDQDSEEEAASTKGDDEKMPIASSKTTKKNIKKICKRFEEKEKKRAEEAVERRKAELAAAMALGPNSRRRRLREGADLTITKEVYGVSEPAPIRPSS